MKRQHRLQALTLSTLALALAHAHAADETVLPGILVTTTAMDEPLTVVTDPKAARQPLPAHDGADYLKTIPGFSVTRKGGTDGDALFRGMAGSRLGILVDGENILGGCNYRMDAPTAYIYPELYDALTVIKGAQTVQHGPGNSAATVLFERHAPSFDAPGYDVQGSVLAGSFDRRDAVAAATAGSHTGYVRLDGTHSEAGDYEDGDGNAVHSAYERESASATLGWTPDANTRVEAGVSRSDGEAAYADRAMDGTKFLRESTRLHAERSKVSSRVEKLTLTAYDSDVDHVMDDQTLRTPGTMGYANLARATRGGQFAATLNLAGDGALTLGADAQDNDHRSRSAPPSGVYTAWSDDASFRQRGLYAELDQPVGERSRLVTGLRRDSWDVTDERQAIMVMTMMGMAMHMNPTAGASRDEDLTSGFLRLEHTPDGSPATWYAGVSQTQRFPDYWEMIARRSATSDSAFLVAKPEQTQQIDTGVLLRDGDTEASISLFYANIDDYLLIDYAFMDMDKMMTGVTRNIEAKTFGGEAGISHTVAGHWKFDASGSWTRGNNVSDGTPLAQVAPAEVKVGVTWATARWSVGGLVRGVAAQDRYDLNRGNIVGKDLGATPGFAVLSVNGNWKPVKQATLSAGIDNLTDRRYAEFISRAGATGMSAVPGYTATTRVNEPGRTLWLKASLDF